MYGTYYLSENCIPDKQTGKKFANVGIRRWQSWLFTPKLSSLINNSQIYQEYAWTSSKIFRTNLGSLHCTVPSCSFN